jgi:hypothetical protein
VFGWLERRFAPKGLGGLGNEPRLVRVEGRITSDNRWQSPLTGLRAAACVWRLVVRYNKVDRLDPAYGSQQREVFEQIAFAVRGSDLLVDTKWGSLLVEMEDLVVHSPGSTQGVVSLDRPPPIPEFVEPFEASERPVSIQETTLGKGDLVRVNGYVERIGIGVDRGAYRTAQGPRPDFRTRRDLGGVELVDLSLTEL